MKKLKKCISHADERPMIKKALELAKKAHKEQFRYCGEPYFNHVYRVYEKVFMAYVTSESENVLDWYNRYESILIAAILHDVVEDTDITFQDLKDLGFSNRSIYYIALLTKQNGDDYIKDYIYRITKDEHAIVIKYSDLEDNLTDAKEKNKYKYKKAQAALNAKMNVYKELQMHDTDLYLLLGCYDNYNKFFL